MTTPERREQWRASQAKRRRDPQILRAPMRGVRWDPDMGEFQMRCDSCSRSGRGPAYWPLTLDYWVPKHGMSRCRACHLHVKAKRLRERLARDPEMRARKLADNRERRKLLWPKWEASRRERLLADPEKLEARRAKNREAQRRYRARRREQAA